MQIMLKSWLVSSQKFIFDTLLENLLSQFVLSSTDSCNLVEAHACIDALSYAITTVLDIGSTEPLQLFKDQIPDLEDPASHKSRWYQVEYLVWIEEVKTAVSIYRKMQSYWHFSNDQEMLKRYYQANKFLIDCIERHYKLTTEIKEEIETALLFADRQLIEEQSEMAIAVPSNSELLAFLTRVSALGCPANFIPN